MSLDGNQHIWATQGVRADCHEPAPKWLALLACWSWATGQSERIPEELTLLRKPGYKVEIARVWEMKRAHRQKAHIVPAKITVIKNSHSHHKRVTLYSFLICLFYPSVLIYLRSQEFWLSNFLLNVHLETIFHKLNMQRSQQCLTAQTQVILIQRLVLKYANWTLIWIFFHLVENLYFTTSWGFFLTMVLFY